MRDFAEQSPIALTIVQRFNQLSGGRSLKQHPSPTGATLLPAAVGPTGLAFAPAAPKAPGGSWGSLLGRIELAIDQAMGPEGKKP